MGLCGNLALHISSSTTLNIQIDTLSNGIQNNGSLKAVPRTSRDPSRELSNGSHAPKCSFVPKLRDRSLFIAWGGADDLGGDQMVI